MTDDLTPIRISPEWCEYLHRSGLRLIFSFIMPTSRGVDAFVEVRWQGNIPSPRVLHFGRYDLVGNRTVASISNQTVDAAPPLGQDDPKALVRQIVTEAVYDVVQVVLNGEPAVVLAEVDPHDERWLLEPLVEAHSHTRIIAPGGAGKSMFALAIAITVATGTAKLLGLRPVRTGPVLYLDWEADAQTHNERLRAMCKSIGLTPPKDIHYLRMASSFHRNTSAIARNVVDTESIMILIDSNAMARGVSGEGSAEDSTLRMFAAMRSLGIPAVILDHKSDEKIRRGLKGGYGSVFNQNLTRLEWEVNRYEEHTPDSRSLVYRLEKTNNTRKGLELGYRINHINVDKRLDVVEMQVIEPSTVRAIKAEDVEQTNEDRLHTLLSQSDEPRTVAWLADHSEIPSSTVRRTLNRNRSRFEAIGQKHSKEKLWRAKGQPRDEGELDEMPVTF